MKKILSALLFLAVFQTGRAQVCPQFVDVTKAFCTTPFNDTENVTGLATQLCGDSITIVFNDSGTVLQGDTNVYIQSAPQFVPFAVWGNYTVGNFGQNDGVGRMDSIGPYLYSITINPRTYFGYPVDSCLNGIWFILRNYNGSIVMNNGGNNYFLYTVPDTPVSESLANVTATKSTSTNVSYLWSDGDTASIRIFTNSGGNYTITATGVGGCTAVGTVDIKVGIGPVSIGSNFVRCSASPTVIHATTGYATYQWVNAPDTNASTFTEVNPGLYWVQATDSAGCISNDTIEVRNSNVLNLLLPDTASTCPGKTITIDASTNINNHGDSIVIIYNDSLGQTTLVGDSPIYMHSAPEFTPGAGWPGGDPFTDGDNDQSVVPGKMTSVGHNLWRIAIDPYSYYHISGVDSTVVGIWLIFRNLANTAFGKDDNGANIFINLQTSPPTSTFNGITVYRTPAEPIHYSWSNVDTSSVDTFTTGGTYYVTVSDNNGCSKVDSVTAVFGSLAINLGADTTICKGTSATLFGPAGYVHYTWSANVTIPADTNDYISVDSPGIYTLTVLDTNGCLSTGSRTVSISTMQVNLGNDIVNCIPNTIDTLRPGSGFAYSYFVWNDGNITQSPYYIANKTGEYWVKAIDTFGCSSYDTIQIHNSEVNFLSIPDSLSTCPGNGIPVNASTNINLNGDSIVIIYNDTLGVTTLKGDTAVYMHSAPQFTPFAIWPEGDPFTDGDSDQNISVGKMTSLGNNQWRIAIDPYAYYHVSASDSTIIGIWLIFRNYANTQFGKDDNGNNIFINLQTNPPTSTFNGVTVYREATQPLYYYWSNNVNTAADTFTTAGTYYVTVSDNNGCSKTDSIVASFGNQTFSLGNDTTICKGASITLTGPANKQLYNWSVNNTVISPVDTTDALITDSAGLYSLTFRDTSGCYASGSITISEDNTQVNLGKDVTRCSPTQPVTISSGGGTFISYQWVNEAATTNNAFTADKIGLYWVAATDNFGCVSYDTIEVSNSSISYLSIPDSLISCPGHPVTTDASTNINLHGDSVIILYNDSLGESTLANDTNIYIQSAPQFTPFAPWGANDNPYTVGNWGQNDGVGRMTQVGHNLWQITIDPYAYYHVSGVDSTIIGIWMVFRNFDGAKTGKDDNGNNIFVNLQNYPPTSTFNGVTATRKAAQPIHYNWSDGDTSSVDTFSSTGTFYVTAFDDNGCVNTDSVYVNFGNPSINLGDDTTICKGQTVTISGPAGIAQYAWSNGDSTQTIKVGAAGTYSLTTTDVNGCQRSGSITIAISTLQVSLGNNILQCSTAPVTLNATTGFESYSWLNGAATNTTSYDATNPGPYWILALDSFGCTSYDTITVHYSDVNGLSLPDTFHGCPGSYITLDANQSIQQNGDSLVIIYNAKDGQSGLAGANKVYFHSAPEFLAGQGWQEAFTVGDWGLDNGIGEMDSIGNNEWEITIDPYDYYNMNPDTPLAGIYMVFRNANGSATGKDDNGNNIFLNLSGPVPTSTFAGIYAFRKAAGSYTYSWSTGPVTSSILVESSGTYTVTVTDNNNCTKVDSSVVALTNTLTVNLGNDTTICAGDSVLLNAGSGFTSYAWNTGDSTQTIKVATAGTYSITVTGGNCSASDSLTIAVRTHGVSIAPGNVVRCTGAPDTLTASSGFVTYDWFSVGPSSAARIAVNPGPYWVEATDSFGCISYDTVTMHNSDIIPLAIPDSLSVCSGDTTTTNASIRINEFGDSVVIIYNALDGQSGLAGAAKVYMHSSPEFYTGQGWNGPYTVGNWGEDDGVGEMTPLGGNQWRIAIDPYDYYHINPDTPLVGIYMVFRNADGTETGKDNNGDNIFVAVTDSSETSAFAGVTGSREATAGITYNWSNGVNGPVGQFTTGGTYMVTASDLNGCSDSASVTVTGYPGVTINLGNDTLFCQQFVLYADTGYASYIWSDGVGADSFIVSGPGTYSVTVTNSSGCSTSASITIGQGKAPVLDLPNDTSICNDIITLKAGSGFTSYVWNTGATTESLRVDAAGTYSVTVTDSSGCSGSDTTDVITKCATNCHPVASIIVLGVTPLNEVTLVDTATNYGAYTYYWSFGDGATGSDSLVVHTYATSGVYKVELIVTDSCGSDTTTATVPVNYSGISSVSSLNDIKIYPNPASELLNVEVNVTQLTGVNLSLIVRDMLGQVVKTDRIELQTGRSLLNIDVSDLAEGVYTIELNTGEGSVTDKFIITR